MDRDEFFAMLDQLTPSQVEARLPLWDHDQLKWVGEYLERRDPGAAQGRMPADAESAAALAISRRAQQIATAALMIAIGAMLAAIVAGLAVYEALQRQ